MPVALYALMADALGIGVTEFVIMGLLLEVGRDVGVSIAAAGMLISGYALGVTVGAPVLTVFTARWPRKQVLIGLMVIFVIGNAACAMAPGYGWLMAARVLTALTHGTFFGIGALVSAGLVPEDKRVSAIAIMFTGLTVATVLGVPFGTWLGQHYGWRATFCAVTLVGVVALGVLTVLVPRGRTMPEVSDWRADLATIARLPVVLGLLTTVLSYAGVFAVFSYIAPPLTGISGFEDSAVSPILLDFGGWLVAGNLLADRNLVRTILGKRAALAVVLTLMIFAFKTAVAAVLLTGLLGAAGFATVTPLQMWILSKAEDAGQGLASSFNIGVLNLGNAIGAWAGGVVIDHGPGLTFVPLIAAAFPVAAILVAVVAANAGSRAIRPGYATQTTGTNDDAN